MADGIRVRGLREAVRSLERYGTEVADLKDVMFRAAEPIITEGRARAPKLSGRLAGSIRAGKAKGKVTVRAGGAALPYAEVIHYGWPGHNIAAQPFLADAVEARQGEVLGAVDDGLQELARRLDLD